MPVTTKCRVQIYSTVFLVLALDLAYSATVIIKSKPSESEHLFEDTSFVFSKDVKDDKAPTVYNGDPMKAQTKQVFSDDGSRGKFHNAYGTSNGIEVESVGKLKETSTGKAFIVSGSYSYTGADGKRYRVRYTADEFGYHPMTELELNFPDPTETNRVGRTQQDALDKLSKQSSRTDNIGGINGGNNGNNIGSNRQAKSAAPTKSSSGYSYDAPAGPDRIYLPPFDVRNS